MYPTPKSKEWSPSHNSTSPVATPKFFGMVTTTFRVSRLNRQGMNSYLKNMLCGCIVGLDDVMKIKILQTTFLLSAVNHQVEYIDLS